MTNYWQKMKLDVSDMTELEKEKRKEAYEKAHEIRKFEIGLFWQRATYYWAFILAAFTAHFALIGVLFGNEKKAFSIPELCKLPGLSLFALAVTAFFCYFFSLCWVLMNKGSKFWQKNWEKHIDELEQEFSGDLYKVIPNTDYKNEFCCCSLSLQAYDYSVSKITSLTSVVLLIASFFMFLFYTGIIIVCCIKSKNIDFSYCESMRWLIGIALLVLAIALSFCISNSVKGNEHKKEKYDGYWINRDDLNTIPRE